MPRLARRRSRSLGGRRSQRFFDGAISTEEGERREAIAQQELADYKLEAERRMRMADRWAKDADERAIIHGLPQRIDNSTGWRDFLEAKLSGCHSQEGAEEWFRQQYGPSAVEHTSKR